MSKTTATPKSSQKRTYKCGACNELGHNARTCPNKGAPATEPVSVVQEATVEVVTETVAEVPAEVEEPAPTSVHRQTELPMDGSVDLTARRGAPTGRPDVVAAPYDCPACTSVSVLVLVELEGGQKALRCESCRNSSPIKSILKWGASPADKPKLP